MMPEEDFTWPCVRSIEIWCSTCALSILAVIYSFVKHCHKYMIPILGSLLVSTSAGYIAMSGKRITALHPGQCNVFDITGGCLIFISYCIRSRFRYIIFPFIYFEHCRIFTDVYMAWWEHKIFTRLNLGMEEDEPCVDSIEGIVETMTDYLLCLGVNVVVVVGFLISFIGLLVGYCLFHIFFHIWPLFIAMGFTVYPVFFIPDLLLGTCHHLSSSSGKFSLLLLKGLFRALHFYLKFMFDIQYDILEWLGDREQYNKLYRLLLFLYFHIVLGPRAFVYLNNEASLGWYTDKEDLQRYSIVSLSLGEFNSLALEVVTTLLGWWLLCFSSSSSAMAASRGQDDFFLFSALSLLTAITLVCELYLYFLWPRWTPKSMKRTVYPTASEEDIQDDPFSFSSNPPENAEKGNHRLSKQKSSVSLVDLAF